MKIEVTVTYCRMRTVEVPKELEPNREKDPWEYPDREAFENFIFDVSDKLSKGKLASLKWAGTSATDEDGNEVFDIG